MALYIFTKFHETILNGIKVKERTRFQFESGIIPPKMYVEFRFLFSDIV